MIKKIIIDPRTEEEIEVLSIEFIGNSSLKDYQRTYYINLDTGSIFQRNYTNSDWNLMCPIPFNRQLHDRMKESKHHFKDGAYRQDTSKQVKLSDLSAEQLKILGLV